MGSSILEICLELFLPIIVSMTREIFIN